MTDDDIRELLRARPFEPIEFGLSDGRSVLVRHPEQIAVSRRKMFVMLARVRRGSSRFFTPPDGDTSAKDWMMVDLIHVVSAEPANGNGQGRSRRSRPRKR
jgi:hypothetical protein